MDSFPAPAFSKKTFGETRADTVESVFLHRPGGSGVSDPRLQKIRIRNNCAGGKAATVAGYVGPGFHNWPPGHIDQTPDRKRHRPICPNGATHTSPRHRLGNRIQENQCVLKEHRIGRPGIGNRRQQKPMTSSTARLPNTSSDYIAIMNVFI